MSVEVRMRGEGEGKGIEGEGPLQLNFLDAEADPMA